MSSSSAREPEETKDSKELSLDEQVAAALARVDAFDADLGKAKSGMREMTREIGGIMGKIVSATKGRERDYLEELETIEESSDLSAEERRAVMPSAMREEMAAELRLVALPALDECYIASVRHERIILTAPHSVAVVRDDDDIHCAEKWTALITLKLTVAFNELLALNPAVCVWNLFKGCDVSNLDPNYLSAKDLDFSPFHKALHAFRHYNVHNPDSYVETVAKSTVTVDEAVDSAVTDETDAKDDSSAVDASSAKRLFADCCVASDSSTATTTPPLSPVMFACDIHGRGNGKRSLNIDVGICSMEHLWDSANARKFIDKLHVFCRTRFSELMNKYSFYNPRAKGMCQVTVDSSPALHGFWGGDLYTMTTRATLLGACALQFELSATVRLQLATNDAFFGDFALALSELYSGVVVPNWALVADVLTDSDCRTEHRDATDRCGDECQVWLKELKGEEPEIVSYDFTHSQYRRLLEAMKRADWSLSCKDKLRTQIAAVKRADSLP